MNWKKLKQDLQKSGKLLVWVAAAVVVWLAFGELKQGNAAPPKHDPNATLVCVHIITEIVVAGSPGLELVIEKPGEFFADRTPCSTTISTRPETGCRITRKMFARDGDELIVNINRLFAAESNNGRNMFRVLYPIVAGKGTAPQNESFVDPNGQGHGTVHVAVGDPSTCKMSNKPRRRI